MAWPRCGKVYTAVYGLLQKTLNKLPHGLKFFKFFHDRKKYIKTLNKPEWPIVLDLKYIKFLRKLVQT